MEVLIPVVVLLLIGACIIVPVVLKHRLYHAQLTLITKAIEKGVDPAAVRSSLQLQPRSGDINGNWKAGVILVAFGLGLFLLVVVGDNVWVVAAFQNVGAAHLQDLNHPVNCDVLVCGDNEEAKDNVLQLVEAIEGMRGIDAGPLANAVAAEALTPVLLYINKCYGITGAGIRITGLE